MIRKKTMAVLPKKNAPFLLLFLLAALLALWGMGCEPDTESSRVDDTELTPVLNAVVNSNIHGIYSMVAVHSGKALDCWSWGTTDGTNIAQYDFWGAEVQQFNISRVDGIWHRITPMIATDQAMDVNGCVTDTGANIQTWTYWGGNCQQFRFQNAGAGKWRIIARNSGMCLEVVDASTENGANVVQNECISEKENQMFELVGDGGGPGNEPITVYIAGDSTVATYTDTSSTRDQAGWGQMFHEYYNSRVSVVNRARGGRTALWFYLEGGVDSIMSAIAPGDYFLIQFGTNDSHTTATFTVDGTTYARYADPDTNFKEHLLQHYIIPARRHGAIPVLVTPPPRNSAYCTGGNSLGRWAQAMRELGKAYHVAVADLNAKTVDYLMPICPSPTPENFYFIRSNGTVDGTHFQENGARILAGFVAEGIEEAEMGLADYGL